MDSMTDDVVVVGGRCAGAPAAMLLARAGLSVRLLERSARLGDVVSGHLIKPAGVARLRRWNLLDAVLATGCPTLGDAGHHKDPAIARGIADAFRDADLVASDVIDGWRGDLEAALAEYGRQRDRCAIPLSDANLGIARLDMADGALGAAWSQMTELEQALDDPEAIGD